MFLILGIICVLSGILCLNNWLHISFHGLSAMLIPLFNLKYCLLYFLYISLLDIIFKRVIVLWKVFLSPSIIMDSFASYHCLGWLTVFRTCNASLLTVRVYTERSVVILKGFPLYVTCAFFSCSFQYTFFVVYI